MYCNDMVCYNILVPPCVEQQLGNFAVLKHGMQFHTIIVIHSSMSLCMSTCMYFFKAKYAPNLIKKEITSQGDWGHSFEPVLQQHN